MHVEGIRNEKQEMYFGCPIPFQNFQAKSKFEAISKDHKALTSIPSISAFSARNSVMWLVRLKGAVSQRPGWTLSWPPPRFRISEIALSNASVFKVTPSPTPPKSERLKARDRSLGMGLGGGAKLRNTNNRSTAFLCHATTRINPMAQLRERRTRWDSRNEGTKCLWSILRRWNLTESAIAPREIHRINRFEEDFTRGFKLRKFLQFARYSKHTLITNKTLLLARNTIQIRVMSCVN